MAGSRLILIAHRGNTTGPSNQENSPPHILKALLSGYDVEVDVWKTDSGIFLGHDKPEYKTNLELLKTKGVWCHAKSLESLEFLLSHDAVCFWHEEDERTLTSNKHIWTYPLKKTNKRSIIVCKDLNSTALYAREQIYAVCSDFVELVDDNLDKK